MPEYQYHPEPDPEVEWRVIEEVGPNKPSPEPSNDEVAALHCIAMARDAIARSPLKAEWTQEAFNWLDGAVAILMKRGDA